MPILNNIAYRTLKSYNFRVSLISVISGDEKSCINAMAVVLLWVWSFRNTPEFIYFWLWLTYVLTFMDDAMEHVCG